MRDCLVFASDSLLFCIVYDPRICTRNLKVFKFYKNLRSGIVILHKGERDEKKQVEEINDNHDRGCSIARHIDRMQREKN